MQAAYTYRKNVLTSQKSEKNARRGYRFLFNGKEIDNEGLGGGGSSYDYGFRIYNPQIGRFLSVDPLGADYPWYTPYQFAGNNPIWFVDIDGAEPGVILGTSSQVAAVNTQNGTIPTPNWKAYELVNLSTAKTALQSHINSGNKVKAIYIQVHGSPGEISIFAGADNKLDNKAIERGGIMYTDDENLSGFQISWYLKEVKRIGEISSKSQRERETAALSENKEVKKIKEFVDFLSVLDEGTKVIIGGCSTGSGTDGSELLSGLKELTGGRLDFIASGDAVSGGNFYTNNPQNNKVLDVGLSGHIMDDGPPEGWKSTEGTNVINKGLNLQLNSSGNTLFQYTDE